MRTVVENRHGISEPIQTFEEYLRRKLSNSQERRYTETDSKLTQPKSEFVEELIRQFCK